MEKLNGANVVAVTPGAWREVDQHRVFDGARIVGRATVDIEGGGRANGLVVKRWAYDVAASKPVERTYVIVWERDGSPAGVFRALAVDGK